MEYKGELLVCKYCKSTYETQEEISESLVIQLNGANVDKNRFLFDDALEKYSLLLKDYPDNAEANWGAFLCSYGIIYEEDVDKYSVFMWRNYFGTVENCRLYNCGVTMQSTGERLGYYVMDSTGSSKRSTWLEKIEVYNEELLPAGQSVSIVRKTYDRQYYNYLHISDWVIATPDGYKEFYRSADTEWVTSKWGEYPTPCTGFDD